MKFWLIKISSKKKQPLTAGEWEIIKKVPEYVQSILGDLPRFSLVKEIACALYEHWDGTGYPHGRKGEEIPLSARIVSIANVYDTLRCKRSYRPAYSQKEAVDIITGGDKRVNPSNFYPKILSLFKQEEKRIEKLYREEFNM